jgi:prolycopene isomerase
VNAVVFSGFGCAHRVAVDLGMEKGWPVVDAAYKGLLSLVRDRS